MKHNIPILLQFSLAVLLQACSPSAPVLHGTVLARPRLAANFALNDQHGRAFSLASQRGHAVALYFGFTHCRDVCPQTLQLLGKARSQEGLTQQQLRVVMITVDPKRDTAAALEAFFRRTGVRATGLTGSAAQLAPIYKAYGVGVQPQGRDIAHTDVVFVIGSDGRLRELLDPRTPLDDVAHDLRAVVDS